MDIPKNMEALCIRTELALWKGRRSIYGARRKALSSEYVLKKDVVDRMERSLLKHFSLFSGNYEDKLEKEKWEVSEAKKAYDKVVFYIEEGGKRILQLEQQERARRTEGTRLDNKEQDDSAPAIENRIEMTRKRLIQWCEVVEDASSTANSITSFLEDLVVCIERSNSGKAENSELIRIKDSTCEIEEEISSLFKTLQQKNGETDLWKNIKPINVRRIMLMGENNGGEMQVNALLYAIQNEMQDLQKLLAETFAAIEDDGEHLLNKLRQESREGNLETDERVKSKERSSVKNAFSVHLENKHEKQEESYPPYPGNKIDIKQKAVFPEGEFQGEEFGQEREALLEGICLLREELKSVRTEMQKDFKRSRGRLLGKYKMDFNDEEEVPEGIKKLDGDIQAWRRQLKEFRRKTRNFPCALDGFVSVESKRMNRDFQNENAVPGQAWYFTYVDDLETSIKTTQEQLSNFRIDV